MPRLEIYQAGCAPLKSEIPEGAYLAGAGDDCHIKLTRPDVSRHHAQLVISAGRITVIDLGSSNGTIIGNSNEPIFSQQPVDVPSGCEVKFGRSTTMKIFLTGKSDVPRTQTAAVAPSAEKQVSSPKESEKKN